MSNRGVTGLTLIDLKQKRYLYAIYCSYMISTRNDKGSTEELLEIIIGKMYELGKFYFLISLKHQ